MELSVDKLKADLATAQGDLQRVSQQALMLQGVLAYLTKAIETYSEPAKEATNGS